MQQGRLLLFKKRAVLSPVLVNLLCMWLLASTSLKTFTIELHQIIAAMPLPFEQTRSYCYQFGRYTVLPEIEAGPQVSSGAEFRMVDLVQMVLDKYLTPEQQQIRVKRANSEQADPLHSIVKFLASFIAKENDLFVRVRPGIYRAHTADEIVAAEEGITDAQIVDAAIADGDVEAIEFDGWIYAFSFPALARNDGPRPIKIGYRHRGRAGQ